MSVPTHSDFLEQAKHAQATLKSLLAILEHKDNVVRLVINKAYKVTVHHCPSQLSYNFY